MHSAVYEAMCDIMCKTYKESNVVMCGSLIEEHVVMVSMSSIVT